MANILIQSPFEYLTDRNGRALANGKIYIGEPDKDPENFPVAAFFDVDGTVPAPQPIRTNSAGFPCDMSGNPQRIYTAANYSIRVSDQNGAQIVYAANSADGFYGVIASDLANQVDPDLGSGMVGWVYAAGASGDTLHDKIKRGWVDVKDFGAVGDGLANDKAAFDAAASTGRTILLTAGTYNVPSGDYSTVRFYSFDGATTNNGTIAVVDPLASSVPVGVEAFFSCDDSALPFGWVALNGNVLNRLVYPQLWAFAEGSGNIVDEADKAANPSAFGRGDGTSTFSLPNKRGTVAGYQDDGASVDTSLILGKRVEKSSATGADVKTQISVGAWAVRAFAQAVNEGTIDIAALQSQVAALQTDVTDMEMISSGEIAISVGGLIDYTHGLGVRPRECYMDLICKTAEAGWSIGDVVQVSFNFFSQSLPNAYGSVLWADTTKVYARFGNTGITTLNKSTGAQSTLTPANWRAIIRLRK